MEDDASDIISGSTYGGRGHVSHDSDDLQHHMDSMINKPGGMNGHAHAASQYFHDHVHHGTGGGSSSRNGHYSRGGGDAMDQAEHGRVLPRHQRRPAMMAAVEHLFGWIQKVVALGA